MSFSMKKNIAIKLDRVTKNYKVYDRARDRVKEAFSITRKKYHRDFCAVKDISLEIKRGEVVGLFGLNGAGKSTLLKMIAGVVTPSSGRVLVHGHMSAMLELGGNVNPELTGMQNVIYNLDLNKIKEPERTRTIKEIVDFAEIGDYINQPVKSYSSGMRARLAFGISTTIKPEILIVDEVLAVGDAVFQNKCFVKIRQLLKGGTTVIFVSHNISLMVEICNRAIFLHQKEILLDGEPKLVAHHYQKALFSADQEKAIQEIKLLNGGVNFDNSDSDSQKISSLVEDGKELDLITKSLGIYDTDGEPISFLETGMDYDLSLMVVFKRNFDKVKITFSAQDVTGKKITTFNSYSSDTEIENISCDEKYVITNKFKCDVFKGHYTVYVKFFDIGDDRFDSELRVNEIGVRFEVGIISRESKVEIQKLK